MAIINGINYGNIIFSKRHEIDKKAYELYYSKCEFDKVISFNAWYGSKSHKYYANIILRKEKLKKLKNIEK
jgi:hypothetical protein